MKKNIILILVLLGYLTYIFKYLKTFPQYPSTKYLFQIILWILVSIIITGRIILNLKKVERKPKVHKVKSTSKQKRKRAITPFDKKFKRNYAQISKKHKNEVQVPDLKSAYIESAWEEVSKI